VSLPNGVTAEPREITKDDTEVKFELKAAPDAQVGQHKQLIAQFTLEKDGEPMTNSVARGGILRVDKASVAREIKLHPCDGRREYVHRLRQRRRLPPRRRLFPIASRGFLRPYLRSMSRRVL
jgi:hypothetical protein